MRKIVVVTIIALIIVGASVASILVLYRPNFQLTEISIPNPMIRSKPQLIEYSGRVSRSHSFTYTASESLTCYLTFGNEFSIISSKSVALTYSVGGQNKVDSFTVPAGTSVTRTVNLVKDQLLSGSFSVSGGSGDDVNFSLDIVTYTQSVSFSFTLVNAGYSDGFAVVEFKSDSTTVWSNRYYLKAGEESIKDGTVTIPGREDHTFNLVVAEQGRS